jgi:FAD binding domain
MLATGYITTSLHWFFLMLQLCAAVTFPAGKFATSPQLAESRLHLSSGG